MVSLLSMIIQFVAIAERDKIMLNKNDPSSTNLFSFIFSMGILVSFFKLTSDILVIYGAKKVSDPYSVWSVYTVHYTQCTYSKQFVNDMIVCTKQNNLSRRVNNHHNCALHMNE